MTLFKGREALMRQDCGGLISGASLLGSCVRAKVDPLIIEADCGGKFSGTGARILKDAFVELVSLLLAAVPLVFAHCAKAQVVAAVIQRIAVDVVDDFGLLQGAADNPLHDFSMHRGAMTNLRSLAREISVGGALAQEPTELLYEIPIFRGDEAGVFLAHKDGRVDG